MLAYDSNTVTSDNSQVQKKMKPFSLKSRKTQQWEKVLVPFLTLSALPGAGWFTKQNKYKTHTTCTRRVMKLLGFQLDFKGAEKIPGRH